MDYPGEIAIPLLAPCLGKKEKLRLDEPLGLKEDLRILRRNSQRAQRSLIPKLKDTSPRGAALTFPLTLISFAQRSCAISQPAHSSSLLSCVSFLQSVVLIKMSTPLLHDIRKYHVNVSLPMNLTHFSTWRVLILFPLLYALGKIRGFGISRLFVMTFLILVWFELRFSRVISENMSLKAIFVQVSRDA